MARWILAAVVAMAAAGIGWAGDEPVGQRPYELDWAGRTQDDNPPLVDFEDLDGWTAAGYGAAATLARTREQQLWGRYVGKLTYRSDGDGPREVRLAPPKPIPIAESFDAVSLWCYGNNWGWAPDPLTPQVGLTALFLDAQGREFGVYLYHVDWTEWNLLHRRLSPDQIERVRGGGASFAGLLISGARQKDDRVLYFDNLAVFTETFRPLTFAPRPERGVAMFAGQGSGTNTGPGRLPFPTTVKTILPPVLDPKASSKSKADSTGALFTCADATGTVEFAYRPRTGRWDDIEVVWRSNVDAQHRRFRPCVDGGVLLATPNGPKLPDRAERLRSGLTGGVYEAVWRVAAGSVSAEVTYRFRLWRKSLVMDVLAPGGAIAEVRYGRAVGLRNPRLATHPFYPADGGRPATVVFDGPDGPICLTGNVDWCRTNASTMWALNVSDGAGVTYNGGTRYTPLTDGRRADCFERFFLTVSPILEETLPAIPNPVSPWKKVTGTRVWRAHGAGDREADKRFWSEVRRYGMTDIVVTDHETMWRDGGESFTFRTKAAPGKGGDEGARDYSRFMQDTLGFVYGPYNNFTDFAPVNEYWTPDLIARDPQNQLQHAWMRCYAPKPARAVEYCERLSPINQAKFGFSTAYCDVHTAVAPWHRVDYDPRVPGAGTMAAVFYSYGEIMLHQKKAWNGPVYSEGNHHAFYCGLTDGNYGQDQAYRPAENPWLVDFDLRRMHDLACNFGMGAPDMFYANVPQPQTTKAEREAWLDRFLAATVAFGHPGFLVTEGGMGNAMKSYYMLQQLHSRYCLARAVEIRYADAAGRLLPASYAIASGAYKRSQVVVRYSDGTVVAANGSRTDVMAVTAHGRAIRLLPNGYCGWTADGKVNVTNQSPDGGYADCASTPAYIYLDGRGRFTRFPHAAGSGMAVCRRVKEGEWELIPYQGAECGFAVRATGATALDRDRKPIGTAELRVARGLTYVMPVEGAFSYLLQGVRRSAPTPAPAGRTTVIPGEALADSGGPIPTGAKPGERVWRRVGGKWLDFIVVDPFAVSVTLDGDDLTVAVTNNGSAREEVTVSLEDGPSARLIAPFGARRTARLRLGAPGREDALVARIGVRSRTAAMVHEIGLVTRLAHRRIVGLPDTFTSGVRLRGQAETNGFGQTGAEAAMARSECGGVAKVCLAMHPPWLEGAVGAVYARYLPIALPAGARAAFRAVVGKRDGSHLGDGILYRVVVVEASGKEAVAAERVVVRHAWEPIEADLSAWAGQSVSLKLVVDPGPADNSSGDWAAWADMRVETLAPEYLRTLDARSELYRRAAGPFPIQGLTRDAMVGARRGWLRFEGKGINAGALALSAAVNGVAAGAVPEAGGDEVAGRFAEATRMELPREVVEALTTRNRVTIRNPGRDWFSIRRFWIELELADGRKASSSIADVTFTQPPEWPYAEGIGVPFGSDIEVDVWFDP